MRILETERLWLCPLELAGAVRTQELFPHWEIVRYWRPRFHGLIPKTERSSTTAMWHCRRWNAATSGIGLCG
jgi:hypothetical protein